MSRSADLSKTAIALATIVTLCSGRVLAGTPQSSSHSKNVGQVAFDCPTAPPATVIVDLDADLVRDLLEIGEAALAGVAEAAPALAGDGRSDANRLAVSAEQIEAIQRLFATANGVLKQCHVRVYADDAHNKETASQILEYYSGKLARAEWDDIVRVRDGDETVRVSLARDSGAIQGIFVMVSEGDETVLVNVVCDVSPENVKILVKTALEIATELGLEEKLLSVVQ